MSTRPVFVATHPRACSTAFERVFMTRRKSVSTIHEPFGDAFYFGPERMSSRFEEDEGAREKSGFADSTFRTIMDRIDTEAKEGKRVFMKDITYYLVPPMAQESHIAPSLSPRKRGVGTPEAPSPASEAADSAVDMTADKSISRPGSPPKSPPFPYHTPHEPRNPTVVPREILERFHFTFLIRHPRSSIPSYYRCCIPPLVERTGFSEFMPSEAGYAELRALFDYCKETNLIGPKVCGQAAHADDADLTPLDAASEQPEICIIDADDLLDDPETIMRQYCRSIGMTFSPSMLQWDSEEDHAFARAAFEKWDGFHDDAIGSRDLKPRVHKHKPKSDEQLYGEWVEKYGQEAADMIKSTVEANVGHYEYLKQYAIKL